MRRILTLAAPAAALYVAACTVPTGGLFRGARFRDLGVYQSYGDAILDGRLPYRDLFVEYPPGALAAFVLPSLAPGGWYATLFKLLMVLCGLAAIAAVAASLDRLGVPPARRAVLLGLLALSPIAIGPVSLNTYDALPAALTAVAFALLVHRRPTAALVVLALASSAKLYPLVLVPAAAVFAWRTFGPRRALQALGAFAGTAALVFLPFATLAGDGLWTSLRAQASRGLHLESLGASVLLAADRLGLYDATVTTGSRVASADLAGPLAEGLAAASTVVAVSAAIAAWFLYSRGRDTPERLAIAFAAAVAGILAFGKVLSPQYVQWLVPLVPLVVPPAGTVAVAATAVALVLAQLWFFDYAGLFAAGDTVWLLVARNAALVALAVGLLAALARPRR